ncbi:MAG: hypothetical protein HFE85_04850 [Clostridiales bacterium]|nr:hypothetical protein [Clostridiales bacterium]
MKRIVTGKRISMGAAMAVTTAAAALLFLQPESAADGMRKGLNLCATVVIPSLFPFLVVSAFLIRSGLSARMGRFLEPLTRRLFSLPGCTAAPILMGMLGGYPVGVKAAAELYEQGELTHAQSSRMICFCVNAGPAFTIGAVGAGMLGSVQAGAVLYISQVIACLILGIAARFLIREKEGDTAPVQSCQGRIPFRGVDAFVESVSESCRSMMSICAFVALFSSAIEVLSSVGILTALTAFVSPLLIACGMPFALADSVFPALLEVTSGCMRASAAGAAGFIAVNAVCGWAGLSVHCQIFSLTAKAHPPRLWFWAFRAAAAVISSIAAAVLLSFLPETAAAVFAPQQTAVPHLFYSSASASAAMLAFSGILLIAVPIKTGAGKRGAAVV